jgi:hypothetical protein
VYALTHSEEFVRWVPRLLRHELNAQNLRRLLRNDLFAWGQCDGRYVAQPVISWEAFTTHGCLSKSASHEQVRREREHSLVACFPLSPSYIFSASLMMPPVTPISCWGEGGERKPTGVAWWSK